MQLTIEQALQQAVAAHKEGKLNEAENIYRAILQSQPNHPDANHNLGLIAVSLNQIEAAVPLFTAALDANPKVEQFWLSYVEALVKADRLKDARQAIKRAKKKGLDAKKLGKLLSQTKISTESDAEVHFNLGNTLMGLGRLSEAAASYNQAIALKPDYANAHNNLGSALQRLGRFSEAEASYNQAVALRPDDAELHNNLGSALQGLCRFSEAEASYYRAIALQPGFAQAHSNLGNTLLGLNRLSEAEVSYNQAIALEPEFAEAHKNLGLALTGLGRLAEAEASYNHAIALKPDFAEVYRHVTQIKKLCTQDARFLKMLELHRDESMSDKERCHINFGLAKVHEDIGDFERAFAHYAEGNELRKKLLGYDLSQDVELFSQIKGYYPRLEQSSFEAEKSSKEPIPIFIVGMPRSGTTLVEQIVSSHPLVTGAGELPYVELFGSAIATGASDVTPDDLRRFRAVYMEKLKDRSEGNLWITDKMPHNFRYLGLLSKAFPEAKFIHVKRRPEATCWGNFKTYFSNNRLGYAWAIDDIVTYYKLYQSLMEFWGNELDDKVYSVDYELLTDSQEPVTRKLIEFIGLGWDENCLYPEGNTRSVSTASSVQVRKKVYTGSSEQWRTYEPFLNGAFASLSA